MMPSIKNKFKSLASSQNRRSKHAFYCSLAGHILLFSLLFGFGVSAESVKTAPSAVKVVQQATVVNQQSLQAELKAVRAERNRRVAKEQQRLHHLKRQQHKVSAHLKKNHQRLLAEKKRLAVLKVRQRKEKAEIKKLNKAQVAANARYEKKQKKVKETQKALLALQKKEKNAKSAWKKKQIDLSMRKLAETLRIQQLSQEKEQMKNARLQQGVIDRYRARILSAIQQQWVVPKGIQSGMDCEFVLHLSAGGRIKVIKLVRSSGSAVLDRSARAALFKAQPLPLPTDKALNRRFREIRLTVKPMMA